MNTSYQKTWDQMKVVLRQYYRLKCHYNLRKKKKYINLSYILIGNEMVAREAIKISLKLIK